MRPSRGSAGRLRLLTTRLAAAVVALGAILASGGGEPTYGSIAKGGMQEIAHEPLSCGPVVRFDRLTPEDGESGMLPAEQEIYDPGGD
jgi:hypothetical protein